MNELKEKVLFRYSGFSTDNEIECMWTLLKLNDFQLDNIPLYTRDVSFGDMVSADEMHGQLHMKALLKSSGHSTIRILLLENDEFKDTDKYLEDVGLPLERSEMNDLIALDIPPEIS